MPIENKNKYKCNKKMKIKISKQLTKLKKKANLEKLINFTEIGPWKLVRLLNSIPNEFQRFTWWHDIYLGSYEICFCSKRCPSIEFFTGVRLWEHLDLDFLTY